jgi:hypothetical protein
MSLAEYEKHADQIDQAMLSGQLWRVRIDSLSWLENLFSK